MFDSGRCPLWGSLPFLSAAQTKVNKLCFLAGSVVFTVTQWWLLPAPGCSPMTAVSNPLKALCRPLSISVDLQGLPFRARKRLSFCDRYPPHRGPCQPCKRGLGSNIWTALSHRAQDWQWLSWVSCLHWTCEWINERVNEHRDPIKIPKVPG